MHKSVPPTLAVALRPIDSLKPHPRNSRVHSKLQINRIAASLKEFGVVKPVLVTPDDTVIAGHGVLAAAKLAGIPEIPTIRVDHLTPDQVRAYILADNKLAEQSSWDQKLLGDEFRHLLTLEGAFDIGVTGFEIAEIDVVLGTSSEGEDKADHFDVAVEPAVTRPGDLWKAGQHRILCGNSLLEESFERLGNPLASLVSIDPPFNVPIDGHATGKGRIKHREFAMASGEMSSRQFVRFLATALGALVRHSKAGSIHYVFIDWRHLGELLRAAEETDLELINLCVWVKDNGGMGSLYRSQHELVLVFRNGRARHRNNVQLGRFGRNRTNVWNYAGANSFARKGEEGNLLALHPTVKPVALIADAILDSSARGEIVLDTFLGSGSTLIAAERTGRACYGIEIDPLYVDTALRRWQRVTGERVLHAETGKPFDEPAQEPSHG